MVSGLVPLGTLARGKGETRVHDMLDSSISTLSPPSPRFPPHFPILPRAFAPKTNQILRLPRYFLDFGFFLPAIAYLLSLFLACPLQDGSSFIATASADWCVTSQQPTDGPDHAKQRDKVAFGRHSGRVTLSMPCVYTSPNPL